MIHSPEQDARRLNEALSRHCRIVVAFSGGVDSSVVAAAAQRAAESGQVMSALAVTADSASVPRWQIEIAQAVASQIGIDHRIVETDEGERPEYRRNDGRRCFYCKQTLYDRIDRLAEEFGRSTIVSGTNADDLGDYRPGIEAGKNSGVVTPLADLGIGKSQVRELAAYYGLSNQDLPASPCLASRVAYGVEVTPDRLNRIERAERWLRERGFDDLRVRLHEGELARIEVPRQQITKAIELDSDGSVTREFRSLGFKFVTVDLDGLRSGSLNRVLVTLHDAANAKGAVH